MIIDIFDNFFSGQGRVLNCTVDNKLFYAFCNSVVDNDNSFMYNAVNSVEGELVPDLRCFQRLSEFWAIVNESSLVEKALYV